MKGFSSAFQPFPLCCPVIMNAIHTVFCWKNMLLCSWKCTLNSLHVCSIKLSKYISKKLRHYPVVMYFCVHVSLCKDHLSEVRKQFQVASSQDTDLEYQIWFFGYLFFNCSVSHNGTVINGKKKILIFGFRGASKWVLLYIILYIILCIILYIRIFEIFTPEQYILCHICAEMPTSTDYP